MLIARTISVVPVVCLVDWRASLSVASHQWRTYLTSRWRCSPPFTCSVYSRSVGDSAFRTADLVGSVKYCSSCDLAANKFGSAPVSTLFPVMLVRRHLPYQLESEQAVTWFDGGIDKDSVLYSSAASHRDTLFRRKLTLVAQRFAGFPRINFFTSARIAVEASPPPRYWRDGKEMLIQKNASDLKVFCVVTGYRRSCISTPGDIGQYHRFIYSSPCSKKACLYSAYSPRNSVSLRRSPFGILRIAADKLAIPSLRIIASRHVLVDLNAECYLLILPS